MEKWQIELYETPIWLLKSFLGVVLASAILLLLVSKTRFVVQFMKIARLCVDKNNALKLALLSSVILILVLLEVRFRVLNTFFFNGLYTSLENKSWAGFWLFAYMNLALIGARTVNFIINQYLDQVLQISWLKKINEQMLNLWLSHHNYYHSHFRDINVDNIDQTIQLDTQEFISTTSEFIKGVISSVVSTIEFGIVLWGLSGAMSFLGFRIPKAMVFFVFIYVIVATGIAIKVGSPLIWLNFIKERLNGNYRYHLVRIKEYAESIAFYGGEIIEKHLLKTNFADIIKNRWRIVYRTLSLQGFNYGFTESVKIFPLCYKPLDILLDKLPLAICIRQCNLLSAYKRHCPFLGNFMTNLPNIKQGLSVYLFL